MSIAEIWLVDDDASIRFVLSEALQDAGYRARGFESSSAAMDGMLVDSTSPKGSTGRGAGVCPVGHHDLAVDDHPVDPDRERPWVLVGGGGRDRLRVKDHDVSLHAVT